MTDQILAPQWGKQLLDASQVADREFQIWMDDLTECVNDFTGGIVGGSITINGVLISDLTLEGRSTEFTSTDDTGVYTHYENFSYETVVSGETLLIRENQQMVLVDGLNVDGEIILEEGASIAFA